MTNLPDGDFLAAQTALAGEYSLEREIGRGGMGVIYLAREVSLGRQVAIKILRGALAERAGLREAFLREARTIAQLSHPNIVAVHAAGVRQNVVFISMAYVDGTTLGQRLRARGPMMAGQAAQMMKEVCWALAYAHSAGVVHRDISAENIVIERATGRAIVMDFGIASAMQTVALSDDGQVIGNAHYISPEQARGEPVDGRSDIYSLGVCGFYALTGKLPFDGPNPSDIVHQHLTRAAPRVGLLGVAVPGLLGKAIDKALAKNPDDRHRTAENFAEALDLASEPVRGIPAPLRTWISQGEREGSSRLALLGVGIIAGVSTATLSGNPAMFFWPFPVITIGSFLPSMLRLRRVLGEGYDANDVHSALTEHALAREEEVAYERSGSSPRVRRLLWLLFGGSVAASLWFAHTVTEVAGANPALARGYLGGLLQTLFLLGASSVLLIGDYSRMHLSTRLASLKISFWKGAWGRRLAKVIGVGLANPGRPVDGLPLSTEIALGRATDHLFQSLPKASRNALAALPMVVKRLEDDASALRIRLGEIDTQLGVFDRATIHIPGREQMEADLRDTRVEIAARLSAAVTSLEAIRLDLLRLLLGHSNIESVTAALDAAREIGEQLTRAAEAHKEIERILGPGDSLTSGISDHEEDDADTPIGGVPVAKG